MSGSRKADSQQEFHQMETIGLIIAMIILTVIGMWYGHRAFIVKPIFAIDWLNYKIAFWLSDFLGQFIHHITTIRPGAHRDFLYILGVLKGANPAQGVTLADLGAVQLNVGESTGFGAALFTIVLMIWSGLFNAKAAPKRRFMLRGWRFMKIKRINGIKLPDNILGKMIGSISSMKILSSVGIKVTDKYEKAHVGEDFIAYQARQWRHVTTAVNFDVNKRDPRWRLAETGLEWCKRLGIKHVDEANFETIVRKAMIEQIGKEYETIEDFPIHARAILALAWINRTRGMASYKLAGTLAEVIHPHFDKFPAKEVAALIDPVLDKTKKDKYLKVDPVTFFNDFLKRYTGINTAMIAMVGACGPFRKFGGGYTGPLPPNTYAWLIAADRTLWYCMHNIGSGNYRVEGIAPIHQFKREQIAGKKLPPDMDGPIRGLRDYFVRLGITDFDSYTKSMEFEQL